MGMGGEVLSQGVKRLGREADRSPPSSAEVKNSGPIPQLPHTSSQGRLYLCLRT
jgi:hypothetical protein